MKKILSILLVFFLCYNIAGFFFAFKINQFLVRKEIKERILGKLPVNQLILIKSYPANSENIKWYEINKEFRFKGCMYDVVKRKIVGDTTYYYCYNDTRETKLLGNLEKLVKEQTAHSKTKMISKKLVINYFLQQYHFRPEICERPVHFSSHTTVFTSITPEVCSPPPKRLSSKFILFI